MSNPRGGSKSAAQGKAGVVVRLATVGPAGLSPIAPGTVGSLVGAALVEIIHHLVVGRGAFDGAMAAAIIAVYACGVWAAGRAEVYFAETDPGAVVIDEVAGQMLVFIALPTVGWTSLLAGFIIFRILDVVKPFPARRAEHLPGGWGIMTDDIVAGTYGAVALFLLGFVLR
ncbi:MAG: phosphatidylglycerophosphatase A family protein [Terriglobia bacterium]